MRICVHHDGALGDAVLSLPCIRGIARDSASVEWIGRGDVGRMLTALGVVRAAHDAGGSRFARWHEHRPVSGALDMLERFDLVYLFTARPDADLAGNIRAKAPGARVVVTVPPDGEGTHVAEFRLRQLPPEHRYEGRDVLAVPAGLTAHGEGALSRAGCCGQGPLIVLHPGSGGKRKCWPLDRYYELAERLASRSSGRILFLGGPAEAGGMAADMESFVRGRARMGCITGSELSVVASLLAESGLFIGNDSGVTHLAAAVGAPVIALFGPTDPALWAPRGASVQVIAARALEDISVDAVVQAADTSIRLTVHR